MSAHWLWLRNAEISHHELPRPSGAASPSLRSADARVVAGTGRSERGDEAFVWSESRGRRWLGDLLGGSHSSRALALSADGSTVIGISESALGTEAFVWNSDQGMVGLGYLGGLIESYALVVSDDGATVLGFASMLEGEDARPFIWDFERGMRDLDVLLGEAGIGSEAGRSLRWTLETLDRKGALTDGAYESGAETRAALVPEPSTMLLLTIGLVVLARVRRVGRRL